MSAKQEFQLKKWQCLIKEYQESGKKLKDWCADNNVTKDTYYYWLNRVRIKYYDAAVKQIQTSESSGNTALNVQKKAPFVEISPEMMNEAYRQASLPAAVVLKGNIRIEIMPNATASFIRQLLSAMQHA